MGKKKVLHGDCIEKLKKLPENSVDSVVTDPPYGLSAPPNPEKVLEKWINGEEYEHQSSGFMGKDWDSFVPSPSYFGEMKRVMKPGAFACVFAGTRTIDLMGMSLRLAGFEYRTTIMYCFGSGFPKSRNIYKNDVKGTELMDEYSWMEGLGTKMKPAWEPIIVVRKPLDCDTVFDNLKEWGVGALNIDGCRVDMGDNLNSGTYSDGATQERDMQVPGNGLDKEFEQPEGRFPANTVLSHTKWCVKEGENTVKSKSGSKSSTNKAKNKEEQMFNKSDDVEITRYGDEDGKETVEDWDCPPSCPVRMMGESSGYLHASGNKKDTESGEDDDYRSSSYEVSYKGRAYRDYGSQGGGASRFFYTGKASSSEREMGMEEGKCPHPTVKPLDLIRWLIKLVTPMHEDEQSVVLDPFTGSGTTGIAVAQLRGKTGADLKFLGVEKSDEYIDMCRQRVDWAFNHDWKRHFALQDWQKFDGIGEKRSEDVLDKLGPVETADLSELEFVSGIGEKTANKIREKANE